jgi:hypothetical protein
MYGVSQTMASYLFLHECELSLHKANKACYQQISR